MVKWEEMLVMEAPMMDRVSNPRAEGGGTLKIKTNVKAGGGVSIKIGVG